MLELWRRPGREAGMTSRSTVIIDARYRGPPDSGNGGYVCGIVGAAAGVPVAVRLKRPPPLDVPLELAEHDGALQLLRDGELVAEARPDAVDIDVPSPPSHAEAVAASFGYMGFVEHVFPTCFVCGPRRPAGDGLRIFAGSLSDRRMVAAPWIPDQSLAGPDGTIRPEFLWAALDCPGYFATPLAGRMALLGEMATAVSRPVSPGEACVVLGWRRHSDGRKHYSGTAIFNRDGELVARASATWIELKRPPGG
jgi:hypothetical protein